MDIKQKLSRHLHRRKGMKGNTAQLAAQLAPLEEQDGQSASKQIGTNRDPGKTTADVAFGAIVVDQDDMSLPKDIMEGGEKTFFGMEPVVLVILVLMLAFIVFIAWQISEMPAK